MYAVSRSTRLQRIELGGRLLLMAATAAPQPSGNWKVARASADCLTYLWKLSHVVRIKFTKAEGTAICKADKLCSIFRHVSMNIIRGYYPDNGQGTLFSLHYLQSNVFLPIITEMPEMILRKVKQPLSQDLLTSSPESVNNGNKVNISWFKCGRNMIKFQFFKRF